MTDLVDAPQQATDFGRDLVRQSPMLVVQFFQIKTELLVEFVRSRGNEFVDKVIETTGLHYEAGASQLVGERIDHRRKFLWPR